jgi:hypothetical protein
MSDAPFIADPAPAEHPSEGCMRCGDEGAEARAARRLAMADELAQMGMNVARVLEQQVLAEAAGKAAGKPADPAAPRGERDPGLTFTRVARMVSHLLSLADRLDRGVEARAEATRKAAAEAPPKPRDPTPAEVRREEVHQIISDIIHAEFDPDEENDQRNNLDWDAWDHLETYADDLVLNEPVGAIIAKVFEDLDFTPDWSRWKDEDWAVELMAMGDVEEAQAQAP